MTILAVDTLALTLTAFGRTLPCTIGRAGTCPAPAKREGDGMTPIGLWPIRALLFRPGAVALPEGLTLPWRWTRPDDGWSDDPADPAYNRLVRLPRRYSAERLQRDDALYDIICTLGHNDAPPVPGLGSAIFLHCAIEARPTDGCVAIAKTDLLDLLPRLVRGDGIAIG